MRLVIVIVGLGAVAGMSAFLAAPVKDLSALPPAPVSIPREYDLEDMYAIKKSHGSVENYEKYYQESAEAIRNESLDDSLTSGPRLGLDGRVVSTPTPCTTCTSSVVEWASY